MAVMARFSFPVAMPSAVIKGSFSLSPRPMLFWWRRFVPARLVFWEDSKRRRSSACDEGREAVPNSVPVRVAHELLQAGHRFLDVRTVDEFNAGHVVGAANIPFLLKVGPGMLKNPKFVDEVSKAFTKDDEILIGCQSGKRSLMAVAELSSVGFNGVRDVAGGYSAWEKNNLPTEN